MTWWGSLVRVQLRLPTLKLSMALFTVPFLFSKVKIPDNLIVESRNLLIPNRFRESNDFRSNVSNYAINTDPGFCISCRNTLVNRPFLFLSLGPKLSKACCPVPAENITICPVPAEVGDNPRPPKSRPAVLNGLSLQASIIAKENLAFRSVKSSNTL